MTTIQRRGRRVRLDRPRDVGLSGWRIRDQRAGAGHAHPAAGRAWRAWPPPRGAGWAGECGALGEVTWPELPRRRAACARRKFPSRERNRRTPQKSWDGSPSGSLYTSRGRKTRSTGGGTTMATIQRRGQRVHLDRPGDAGRSDDRQRIPRAVATCTAYRQWPPLHELVPPATAGSGSWRPPQPALRGVTIGRTHAEAPGRLHAGTVPGLHQYCAHGQPGGQ